MKPTKSKKEVTPPTPLIPATILCITDNGNGDICVEFNKDKVVEFKEFIKQVFDNDRKEFDEQIEREIEKAERANPYPDNYHPDQRFPHQGMPPMPPNIVNPTDNYYMTDSPTTQNPSDTNFEEPVQEALKEIVEEASKEPQITEGFAAMPPVVGDSGTEEHNPMQTEMNYAATPPAIDNSAETMATLTSAAPTHNPMDYAATPPPMPTAASMATGEPMPPIPPSIVAGSAEVNPTPIP